MSDERLVVSEDSWLTEPEYRREVLFASMERAS